MYNVCRKIFYDSLKMFYEIIKENTSYAKPTDSFVPTFVKNFLYN